MEDREISAIHGWGESERVWFANTESEFYSDVFALFGHRDIPKLCSRPSRPDRLGDGAFIHLSPSPMHSGVIPGLKNDGHIVAPTVSGRAFEKVCRFETRAENGEKR
jgi:hypothetical protein